MSSNMALRRIVNRVHNKRNLWRYIVRTVEKFKPLPLGGPQQQSPAITSWDCSAVWIQSILLFFSFQFYVVDNHCVELCGEWPEKERLHFIQDMKIHEDFITDKEEGQLFDEVDNYMKRLRYEFDHWDDVSDHWTHTHHLWLLSWIM